VSDTAASPAGSRTGLKPVVTSRPQRLRLWCAGVGLLIVGACAMVAVLLPHSDDGTAFHRGDQFAVLGVGILLGGACWLPTRPRLRADHTALHVRGIIGPDRTVPWSVVRSVEFRARWRWARLVLPADETISLYAVQRLDGARSVAVMRGLRELHAAAHEAFAHEAFAREVRAQQLGAKARDAKELGAPELSAPQLSAPEVPGEVSPTGRARQRPAD
jgi:hypothetical protein